MLAADIAGEWAAIAYYRDHQQRIADPYIKELLERIILDSITILNCLTMLCENTVNNYGRS